MTMRLKIENTDQTRTATVTATEGEQAYPSEEIPPGETREFWIHSGKNLRIEEKQE